MGFVGEGIYSLKVVINCQGTSLFTDSLSQTKIRKLSFLFFYTLFLHIDTGSKNKWNVAAFVCSLWSVVLAVLSRTNAGTGSVHWVINMTWLFENLTP